MCPTMAARPGNRRAKSITRAVSMRIRSKTNQVYGVFDLDAGSEVVLLALKLQLESRNDEQAATDRNQVFDESDVEIWLAQ